MEEIEDMEELAMNGSKVEKAERKRLKELEKVKRLTKVDDCYNEEPIQAMELGETILEMVEGYKSPLIKAVLGSKHKKAVNALIDVAVVLKEVAKKEAADLLVKV